MSSDFDINLAISPLRIISVMMMYRLGTRQGRCHRLWLDPPVRPPRLADLEHRPHLLFDRPPNLATGHRGQSEGNRHAPRPIVTASDGKAPALTDNAALLGTRHRPSTGCRSSQHDCRR